MLFECSLSYHVIQEESATAWVVDYLVTGVDLFSMYRVGLGC